jgi:hypothetical protein
MNPLDFDVLLADILDLARLAAIKTGAEPPDEASVVPAFESDPMATLRSLLASTRQAVASL